MLGLGVRSRILFKTLPRNRIFDAGMSGYHKNASDNGQRPPHCPQCIQLWLLNQNTAQTQLQSQHRLLLLLLLLLTLLSYSCLLLLLPLLSYSLLHLLLRLYFGFCPHFNCCSPNLNLVAIATNSGNLQLGLATGFLAELRISS